MITTVPRYVAAPWDFSWYRSGFDGVGREGIVVPEIGPLQTYQSVFPYRYVHWEPKRQIWEIRQVNPDTGLDERVELVFLYDAPPDADTGEEVSEEKLAEMIDDYNPTLYKLYRPFDMDFVQQRLRERLQFFADGPKKYTQRVADKNRRIQESRVRDVVREQAAAMGEIRRYLPMVFGEKKIPLVPVGIDLKGGD